MRGRTMWLGWAVLAGCAGGGVDDLGTVGQEASQGRCFVAFVHGRGDDQTGLSQGELERYWAPDADRDGSPDHQFSMTAWAAGERGCEVLRVGYDGSAAFWDARAAGTVSRAITSWIDERGIAQGELVIVGHSMGGLVVRWIVNQGVPGSPYFDHEGAPYSRVAEATSSVVTIQAPHAGAEVADALFGEADTWYARRVADAIDLLGVDDQDEASRWMRRIEMENASASGGWMGDAARTTTLRTIAGWSTFDGLGNWARWMNEDYLLAMVWGALCHRSHVVNAYVCREDAGEAGDGLVEESSASGHAMRSGAHEDRVWSEGQAIAGARVDWRRVEHNHHQGRFDWHAAEVRDPATGEAHDAWLGSHIGDHIHEF